MQKIEMPRQPSRLPLILTALAVLIPGRGLLAESPTSSDLLLNLFVEKGYVSQQEAEKVKQEAAKRQAELDQYKADAEKYKAELEQVKSDMADLKSKAEVGQTNMLGGIPETRWLVGKGIKSVELFGDARVRYEQRTAKDPGGNKIDLNRERYSLRFGVRGSALDDVYYGFRLETSSNPRSPWVTMGTSSSSSSYQGPFGKSTATLAVGQAYLGWKPEDWINLTVGKMSNPLYTTSLVWDSDINPEGLAEQFKYTAGEADLFANFGQFLYADFNPYNASSGLGVNGIPGLGQGTENILMFAWQGGVNYHITSNTTAKVAATIYNYSGLKRSSATTGASLAPYFGDPYVGEGAYYYAGGSNLGYATGYAGYGTASTVPGYGSSNYPYNQVGLNNLLVLEIPWEVDFKIKSLAARIFGDFTYNLDGAQRAREAAAAYSYISSQNPTQNGIPHSFSAQTQDVKAYQFGFGIGSTNFVSGPSQGVVYGTSGAKHAWEFRTYWQHIEQYSLDPNLIDSDFFEGSENMEGIYAAFAYAFTPNLIGAVRYGYAQRINDQLGTGGSNQDIPQMNPINKYNLFQVDLGFRF